MKKKKKGGGGDIPAVRWCKNLSIAKLSPVFNLLRVRVPVAEDLFGNNLAFYKLKKRKDLDLAVRTEYLSWKIRAIRGSDN